MKTVVGFHGLVRITFSFRECALHKSPRLGLSRGSVVKALSNLFEFQLQINHYIRSNQVHVGLDNATIPGCGQVWHVALLFF